ncbi:MAG TPA: DUF2061 domain-containing protein [Bacteroidia bacterium]|jgi:uncharacterized membrane protein|nr:DUF2061 domain-containing protein [Bacteroidia bacterium]
MKEKYVRSVLKGITWRITGTVDTIVIAFVLTGKISHAMSSIGGVEVATKIVLYYLHERIWSKIKWIKEYEY